MAPKTWDGRTALPLLVYFHGFGDTPDQVIANSDIATLADTEQMLLALPAGIERRWYVRPGQQTPPRDDLAFAAAVVDDVIASYPVDPRSIIASGFSAGGFITWTIACRSPGRFTGFLPVAGALWAPVTEGPCPGGPVDIRHVHGSSDPVVPMAGRQVSSGARQGDIRQSLAAIVLTNRCGSPPVASSESEFACSEWRGCAAGKRVELCMHSGDHVVRAAWIADGLKWLRNRPAPLTR